MRLLWVKESRSTNCYKRSGEWHEVNQRYKNEHEVGSRDRAWWESRGGNPRNSCNLTIWTRKLSLNRSHYISHYTPHNGNVQQTDWLRRDFGFLFHCGHLFLYFFMVDLQGWAVTPRLPMNSQLYTKQKETMATIRWHAVNCYTHFWVLLLNSWEQSNCLSTTGRESDGQSIHEDT